MNMWRRVAAAMKKKLFPFRVTRKGASKAINFHRELTNGLG